MAQEIVPTGEGMPTLAAQFTRHLVEKLLGMVAKLREQGWPESKILPQMLQDLPGYPRHTVRRLYDMSLGKSIPDDIQPSNLRSEKAPKPDTLEVAVKVAIPAIEPGGLIQYQGTCWCVASVQGTTYVLKKLA